MKKLSCMFFMMVCAVLICTPARAFELSQTEDTNHHKMWHKFKRGVVNVFTSPIEFPKQLKTEIMAADGGGKILAGFGGVAKGVSYTVGRLGSGLWDMVSCNLAVPDNYEPLMKPEYVCEHKKK